jgi:hypothetical protein
MFINLIVLTPTKTRTYAKQIETCKKLKQTKNCNNKKFKQIEDCKKQTNLKHNKKHLLPIKDQVSMASHFHSIFFW